MTQTSRTGNVFDRIRQVCERPRAFAPNFTLTHLTLYIFGYDNAFADAGMPSQYSLFREWIYKQHPQWNRSTEWWADHILHANGGDLDKTLSEILRLVDQFLATDGAEFNRPQPSSAEP